MFIARDDNFLGQHYTALIQHTCGNCNKDIKTVHVCICIHLLKD